MESVSALDQLIASLTATISSISDEVNRTYANYILKDKAYTDALAYEAEIDRQRLEKIADNDAYNTNILNEMLRNQVRPAREQAGVQRTAAVNAWTAAKAALETEKGKLSEAEQKLLDAKISEQVAIANAGASNANAAASNAAATAAEADAKAAAAKLLTQGKLFTQQSTQYVVIAAIGLTLLVIAVIVYKKYIKK
jgi:hypothetical protein